MLQAPQYGTLCCEYNCHVVYSDREGFARDGWSTDSTVLWSPLVLVGTSPLVGAGSPVGTSPLVGTGGTSPLVGTGGTGPLVGTGGTGPLMAKSTGLHWLTGWHQSTGWCWSTGLALVHWSALVHWLALGALVH